MRFLEWMGSSKTDADGNVDELSPGAVGGVDISVVFAYRFSDVWYGCKLMT